MKKNRKIQTDKIKTINLLNHYFFYDLGYYAIYIITKYVGNYIYKPKFPVFFIKYKTRKEKFYNRHYIQIRDKYVSYI